jgi:hypothetical protein
MPDLVPAPSPIGEGRTGGRTDEREDLDPHREDHHPPP